MAALLTAAAILLAAPTAARDLHVPAGFTVEKAAGDPEVVFPMFAAFDDRGRLFVAESSGLDLYAEVSSLTRRCRVSLLEDRDGDGRFETARVFADGLVFPMGLAWRDGKLYVADPPEVAALEDPDGDGRADRRTRVLGDFGHTDNGSLHGIVFGPDGLLYMTVGQPDGYRIERGDGTVLEGRSGALIRSMADGSRPEVLCSGFENLVEVAFLPSGEVIGTDNWFTLPQGGVRDALVHLVDGGLYPRFPARGPTLPVTGAPLPALAQFPAVALSGLVWYRGSALPPELRGQAYSAQHNARKVARHVLSREGSTFRAESFDFVTSDDPDFHPSDVLEDADGSLLVVDTGGWYVQHCPTGRIRSSRAPGGIYRVRHAGAKPPEDPWGLGVSWERASIAALCELLGDLRAAVRERARRALSARGPAAVPPLASLLDGDSPREVKEEAAWALHAIPGEAPLAPLRRLLADPDPELATLAARILGLRGDRGAEEGLIRLLERGPPHARRAAAEALARCGSAASVTALTAALAAETDRLLEHALVLALHHLAGAGDLAAALGHPDPRIQKAALLLLDQPPRQGAPRDAVLARTASSDPALREAALKILSSHPEWAGEAVKVFEDLIGRGEPTRGEVLALRGLAIAFAPHRGMAALVARALAGEDPRTPAPTRIELLDAIAHAGLASPPDSWLEALAGLLRESPAELRAQAVHAAAVLQAPALDGELARLSEDAATPPALRLEALRAISSRLRALPPSSLDFLLDRLAGNADPLSRIAAAEALGRSRLDSAQLERVIAAARSAAARGLAPQGSGALSDAIVSPSLLLPALERGAAGKSAPAVAAYVEDALRGGWRPAEGDLRRVLDRLPEDLHEQKRRLLDLSRQGAEALRARFEAFAPLLEGGDAARGRAVFLGKQAACSTCHRIGAEGGQVGPDLTKLGAVRSGRDILESVLAPSSTFARGYESWTVVTIDGQVLGGIIALETSAAIVLRSASGAEAQVSRDAIQTLERQETSIMPEGLERTMTREEMRDLFAYLQGLK